jgi:hypothetical protein
MIAMLSASPNSGDAESIAIIELDSGCHPFY